MASPPGALPANPSELHAYAFANACLRVYTIVSLRDRLRRDAETLTEASRGLHWEMAALFDHLSTCKMFGPVPIPTAVVPMLTHYTNLYATNPNPTVDIQAFPFEYNEYMEGRDHQIQGNKWWDALLDPASVPQAPPSQFTQQDPSHSTDQQQPNGDAQLPPQPTSTDNLDVLPPAPDPMQSLQEELARQLTQVPQSAPAQDQSQLATPLSTAANPHAPYLAVTQTPTSTTSTTTPHAPAAPPPTAEPHFIPYQPPPGQQPAPAAPAAPSASTVAAVAAARRPAILAPPVKAPRQRKKSVKTSEFVDEDPRPDAASVSQGPAAQAPAPVAGQSQAQPPQTGSAEKDGTSETASHAQKKRAPENIKPEDYTKEHDGAAACGSCRTHARTCRTARDGRLRRCLECRMRQARCVWPVPAGAAPETNGAAPVPAPVPVSAGDAQALPQSAPQNEPQNEPAQDQPAHAPQDAPRASPACAAATGPARLVAEVVVTPARRPKRKAAEISAGPSAKRSTRLRAREEDASPLPSEGVEGVELEEGEGGFEARLARAHGEGYVRARLALLVDMARTAEMRLADVLGRVARLEDANERLEGMVKALGAAPPAATVGTGAAGSGAGAEGVGEGEVGTVGAGGKRTRTRSSPRKR
ncbi:hypothetical protein PsYK624_151190 [Phanerochaete sordida]|uniref:Zn(2)-C6 fungal-type domain-containing protein n=1 Tax=Phanerochaete sordida TaxID=48140 RepID=A0A9P3GNQ4_9APHY|nr:hypothetical protein PsYK624_151190 [Phanerochaete sordida]